MYSISLPDLSIKRQGGQCDRILLAQV